MYEFGLEVIIKLTFSPGATSSGATLISTLNREYNVNIQIQPLDTILMRICTSKTFYLISLTVFSRYVKYVNTLSS